ncbi:MAG: acetolactate decarboxylase [Bacteroidaceae bacterium]|nr:acetolactate decarboxylase [Bacteroidaceae bacterium]
MKKTFIGIVSALYAVSVIFCSCSSDSDNSVLDESNVKRETLYQVSYLQSLIDGNYDGIIPVSEMMKHGNIGLGTFHRANGEMTVLDGKVYQTLWDGSVVVADNEETVPFANVTYFDADTTFKVEGIGSMDELAEKLNVVVDKDRNCVYVARLEGTIDNLIVRSELAQDKPYKPLAEVLATDQREFTYPNQTGTIVAIYCPDYMDKLNAVGWHFHFISEDRTKGGHILNLRTGSLDCTVDITPYFFMEK